MIFHIFNSSLISGPETLVMPALVKFPQPVQILLLREKRIASDKQTHVEDYLKKLGLRWQVIEVESRLDQQAVNRLAEVLRAAGPECEVAHAHDVKASYYLLKAARQIKSRSFFLVSTHHGIRARSGAVVKLYELFYTYFILPFYDLVLTVCSEDRTRLLRRGLPASLVQVHLNGVTRPEVTPAQRASVQKQIRQAWGVTEEAGLSILGVVARLEAEKRHGLMLQVLQRAVQLEPQARFVVLCFGRGSLVEELQQQTQALGLQKRVLWQQYRSGLGDELAGFDAVLSFSRAEGLPINLIEAGWAGTPIFAAAVDGVKDLVSAPELGDLFAANDSVDHIARQFLNFLKSPEQMQSKGQNFQQHVKLHFSQEVWLQNLQQIYTNLKLKSKSVNEVRK